MIVCTTIEPYQEGMYVVQFMIPSQKVNLNKYSAANCSYFMAMKNANEN